MNPSQVGRFCAQPQSIRPPCGLGYHRHPLPASIALSACLLALVASTPADARKKPSLISEAIAAYQDQHSFKVPAAGSIEVAFSPNEGSEALVIRVIDSAHRDLRLLSYSFTSVPVVEALVRARHRGVDVKLVADEKDNVSADRSGKARADLGALGERRGPR